MRSAKERGERNRRRLLSVGNEDGRVTNSDANCRLEDMVGII